MSVCAGQSAQSTKCLTTMSSKRFKARGVEIVVVALDEVVKSARRAPAAARPGECPTRRRAEHARCFGRFHSIGFSVRDMERISRGTGAFVKREKRRQGFRIVLIGE